MNKDSEKYYNKIVVFLKGKEVPQDRKEIVEWYDSLAKGEEMSAREVDAIEQNAKVRLFDSIQVKYTKPSRKLKFIRVAAAAAAVLVIGFYSYYHFSKGEEFIAISTEKLAQIEPAQERAIIILPNGEKIDLDKLSLNEAIIVGDTRIIKNADGGVSYFDLKQNKETIQTNILQIPKASTYELTLSDGTYVKLNSDSKLTYPSSFGQGDRQVELEGEAYFEVSKKKNGNRFVVRSKRQTIQVLGTKFNVKAYPAEEVTETTLAEGVVAVQAAKKGKKIVLKPEEQASVNDSGVLQSQKINLDEALAWTNGQFYFDGSNTEDVMREIARWYDITVNYEGAKSLKDYRGKIPRNITLDELVNLLKYAEFKVKASLGKNNRINLIIT